MTVEKLERVLWRLTKGLTTTKDITFTWGALKRAIMKEIGTDERTYRNNRKALITLDWIHYRTKKTFILTNKHL